MIPSIRSMIVAILLAVVALGGGFGVFAEFRINHEPERLATAAMPLRLVAYDATVPAAADSTDQSFGSRFQISEALLAGATPSFPTGNADRFDAAGGPGAVIDPASGIGTASQSAAATPPPETVVTATPSDQPPQAQATTEVAPSETLATATPDDQQRPDQIATEAASETTATTAADDQAQPAQTATVAAPPQTAAAAAAAPAGAADQQDAARKVAARRRLAAVRRVRRTRPTAVAQSAPNNASPQPGFQSAPQAVGGPFVSPPSAKRGQN
jgi:hypothetical protein